jgi:hypothetical protein
MQTLLMVHGEMRWLVVLVGAIALVRSAQGWLAGSRYGSFDRVLMAAFTGFIDLNLLMGLVLLFGLGGLPTYRLEHVVTMLLAVVAAHSTAMWRKSPDDARKFRSNLIVILAVLVLVVVGVLRLRGAWIFR